jgi:hypothetical protein
VSHNVICNVRVTQAKYLMCGVQDVLPDRNVRFPPDISVL